MTDQPFFIPSALFFIACIPLLLGRVPRNRFYGFRTPRILSSDKVWYPANRFGAAAIMLASIVYLLVAHAHPTSGPRDPDFSLFLLHLAAFAGPLVLAIILTLRYTRRLP